jgi:hypothetical protein
MLMASLNDNALRKVICDINQLIGDLIHTRLIRWDHQEHGYVFLVWNPHPAS